MNFLKNTLIGLLMAGTLGTAAAVPITDTFSPASAITITTTTPFSFLHDITDNGFVVGIDVIISALLTINVSDRLHQGNESFQFLIGSGDTTQTMFGSNINNGAAGASFPITLSAALPDLIADGKLNVMLSATSGDYEFTGSTLVATVTKGAPVQLNAVPEPATLALFGLGLLGFAVSRGKSKRNNGAQVI